MRTNLYQSNKWDRIMIAYAAGVTARLSDAFQLEQDNVFGILLGAITAGGTVICRLVVSATEAGTYYAAKDQDGTAISKTVDSDQDNKLVLLGLWEPNPEYPWAKIQVDPETQNAVIDGVFRAGGDLRKFPVTQGGNLVDGTRFRGLTIGDAI